MRRWRKSGTRCSLGWIDEVHAIAAARVNAALQSAAVTQSVEDPVANEDKRYHREKRDDINESSALEIFYVAVHRRT